MRITALLLTAVFLLGLTGNAHAQKKAIRGCGTINQPGSYVLTKNIVKANPSDHCITVAADSVTIDLNGFTIAGPFLIGGSTTFNGIYATGKYLTVKNGGVRGWLVGVEAWSRAEGTTIENLTVTDNDNKGVDIVSGTVRNSTIIDNGNYGIRGTCFSGLTILNNLLYDNLVFDILLENYTGFENRCAIESNTGTFLGT